MKRICGRGGAAAAFFCSEAHNKKGTTNKSRKSFFNLKFNARTDRRFSPVRSPDCSVLIMFRVFRCNLKQTSSTKLNHLHSYFSVQRRRTLALSRKCKKDCAAAGAQIKFKSEITHVHLARLQSEEFFSRPEYKKKNKKTIGVILVAREAESDCCRKQL